MLTVWAGSKDFSAVLKKKHLRHTRQASRWFVVRFVDTKVCLWLVLDGWKQLLPLEFLGHVILS